MSLAEISEFGLIERLAPGCITKPERVVVGIGDDCAVVRGTGDQVHLITTDLLVEGVHFLRHAISPRQLGNKALAVNLSDIAAMGGEPREAFVSLALPRDLDLDYIEEVYAGLRDMAGAHGVNILGGDTTRSLRDLVINITLTGVADADHTLLRKTAAAGDRIFVSGDLGDSAAGLHALLNGHAHEDEVSEELVRRHFEPTPHVELGQRAAKSGLAHAMIDVSDGLGADLGHICEQSGVGCRVATPRLPLSAEMQHYCAKHGLDPVAMALSGGESYVLLITGNPALAAVVDLFDIGEIVASDTRSVIGADGNIAPLANIGWDHLRQ